MNFTTKIALVMITIFTTTLTVAQNKKPLSPSTTATGTINESTIKINYSSPSVRGRAIWGGLVPYSQVWRAGANYATTFETSKDIVVEGKPLAAGKYSFFLIPESDGTAVAIFNKEITDLNPFNYNPQKDAIRVPIKSKKSNELTESLVYKIDTNSVTLSWEYLDFQMNIK